jgi:hypothetical protein
MEYVEFWATGRNALVLVIPVVLTAVLVILALVIL